MINTKKTTLATKESVNMDTSKSTAQSGRPNPVQLAFHQELSRFVKYMTRKAELGPRWKKPEEEAYSRGCNTLFNLWSNYESRLQKDYFIQKLISTGDFLFNIKEYKIAQHHCYGRFLSGIRGPHETLESCADCDMKGLKAIYLPNDLDDTLAPTVIRGLLGEAICSFHVNIAEDVKLKNPKTVIKCVTILKILRLITQTALHKETLCWLVFNGTIHIYTICRHLMALGFSSKALEFVLWACMCMESSVPLMTVRYLSWRCTLYTTVCQCYYDLKATMQAEAFAKRAVTKVNELEDIERISTSETTSMSASAFREAKVKMQIMVFKRVVFETRKRPKGFLRPKTKPNLKDSVNQPWPRTPTERLLTDLFQASTSAQFLAILEALNDSSKRTLHCEAPQSDAEDTVTDVCGELFFAGLELIAGGGGPKHQHAMKHETEIHPSVLQLDDRGLIELVQDGARGVPLQSIVKFVKYAFNYEQWDTFNCLVYQTLELLKKQETSSSLLDIKTLELMLAMERFYTNIKKPKKTASHAVIDQDNTDQHTQGHAKFSSLADDLMSLADLLHTCSLEPFKSIIGHMDPDMITDAALFLWSKCKVQFQRVVSASMEGCKFILNDKDANKWLFLITVVYTALSWSDACTFDPILFAEIALKLSLVLECKACLNETLPKTESHGDQESPSSTSNLENKQDTANKKKISNVESTEKQGERSQTSCSESSRYSSILGLSVEGYSHGVRGLLSKSQDVLCQAFDGVGRARDALAQATGKDIVVTTWIKNSDSTLVNDEKTGLEDSTNTIENMVKALHMELLFVHHRVAVKYAALRRDSESRCSTLKKLKVDKTQGSSESQHFGGKDSDVMSSCDKNPLSKALLLMNKAGCDASLRSLMGTEQQAQLLKESIELIQKAQQQDLKLLKWNKESTSIANDVPSPPILLYRSPSLMIFKPAPFEPTNDQVAWYSMLARSASGNNIKVRLNDYQLPGTGEETPATSDCLLFVKGLKPNQRYVFAVAAYNTKGQLIGKTIGTTSHPILAAHSLPTLMAWGYLAQTGYTVGVPSVAQSACSVLWNHFVIEPKPSAEELNIGKSDDDFKVRLKLLDEEKLQSCSPVLVRQFLQSIFISVDLSIRENFLFCNSLCDNGPLYSSQVARLHECERLLLAIHVAGWLNDTSMCLQAIIQVYGLLAPVIQQKLPAKPVIQILLRCHAVLQEVPSLTRHRRQTSASDSLSHMIATMTYFVAKTLQSWDEKGLCGAIVELGKKMLNLDTAPDSAGTMTSMQAAAAMATANMVGQPPPKTKKKPKPKHKVGRAKGLEKDFHAVHDGHNEELKALEAYMMKLSQKALLNREDDELTGSEDPNILYSYIASLPANDAYKEVVKFKRRTRFLEFFVQVLGKAIDEGLIETSLEWTNDAMTWIIRRNEMLLANKPTIVRLASTAVGQEDEKIKRFATAIVEFGKTTAKQQTTRQNAAKEIEPDEVRMRTKQEAAKPPPSKIKSHSTNIMSRRTLKTKGKTDEEININLAIERVQAVLPDYWRSSNRRKKLRSVSKDELPWKVQLNVLTAGCNLELFLQKSSSLQRFTDDDDNPMYGPSYMDPDWFSFSTSGTLIVSWAGTTQRDSPDPPMGFSGSVMESPPYASPAVTTPYTVRTHQRLAQTETVRAGSRVTAITNSDRESIGVPKSPLVYLGNVFSNLTRAIVLAHRGKYWTMLQNACRCLWNATQTILTQVTAGSLRLTDDPQGEPKSDIDILRGALWRPFFTAADCLMDMMVHLQEDVKLDIELNKKRDKVKKGDPEITEASGFMAGIQDQKGGSSLRFEIPLDNNNIVDTLWIKKLLLYATEMMFYEAKWERVVDVILRFNALSRSRYAESLLPMLIVAQRQLAERIDENGGPSKSQPFIKFSKETGVAEEFIITLAEYERIEPAVHHDPVGHNVYSGSTDALRLISVPLDINDSLNSLRQALEIKHHTARALEHSRQLLLCYLAGQHKGSTGTCQTVRRGSSRVGFVPAQVKPPSDIPVDLSDEMFESVEDVKSYTLQPSQLAVVISSYDKTIEMLQFRQQRGLAAQAMHELGNIMFHSGNIRMAYRWWAEAVDAVLNTSDFIKNWRDIVTNEQDLRPSEVLLQRCGLWGCLLAAVLAAKIAQYVHTSNLGLRQECCLLSSTLFKALFCSTLPHPTADKDYALYDIGCGFEVQELLPGVDILSDVFRSDGRTVVASVIWVTEELARARHLLNVLPLITLCLYFTNHVCRDVQRTADVRILRARVLIDLGLFSQAITVLCELLNGERLPRTSMDIHVTLDHKKKTSKFSNTTHLTEPNNLEVINDIVELRLQENHETLYGPHVSGALQIAHAHLLIAMAATIYAIPTNLTDEMERFFFEKAEAVAAEAAELEASAIIAPLQSSMTKKIGKAKKSDDTMSVKSSTLIIQRKLIEANVSPENLKGLLLCVAEQILKKLDDSIKQASQEEQLEEAEEEICYNLSPSDLELVVVAKLELAQISLQRYHAVTAGLLVYSALRAMEDAAVLNQLDAEKRSPSMFNTSPLRSITPSPLTDHYLTSQARGRLDARLWLTCRLALAQSLSEEDSGMGKLGGMARSVTGSIGSCEHHCRQGCDEAEAFGDVEIAAEFAMLNFVHGLQHGKISEDLISKLEEVIIRLERCHTLSYSGQQLLTLAVIQYADINRQGSYSNDLQHIREPMSAYQQAASVLLKQLINLGEHVDHITKSPVLPLKNIYLKQLDLLVELKLRLGRGLLYGALDQSGQSRFADAIRELELGLVLVRVAAYQRTPIEAQLLFSEGQVQRQMFNDGLLAARKVANTFINAIKQTFSTDHDLGMMMQSYMEIAVTYLVNVRQQRQTEEAQAVAEATADQKDTSKTSKSDKKETKPKAKKTKEKEKLKESEKEHRVAWAAVRAASLVSMAQHEIGLMTGDPEISALKISEKSGQLVPDYALIDLLGTDDVIPTSENNSFVGKNGVVTMGTKVNDTDVVPITWIHLLGYLSMLRRQCSYKALGVVPVDEQRLGTMSFAMSPLFSSSKAQKLSKVHDFLRSELEPYASECCGVFPIDELTLPVGPYMVVTQPTKTDLDTKPTQDNLNRMSPSSAKDFELSVYWGKLEMDAPITCQDDQAGTLVFMYALNSKAFNMSSSAGTTNLKTGLCHVPVARIQTLHEALMDTLELAENDLQPPSQANSIAAKPSRSELTLAGPQDGKSSQLSGTGRKKRTMGIRALSARQKKDDTIRAKLKEHMQEISAIMSVKEDMTAQEVPFEVSLKNVACLEAMFDPTRGLTTKTTESFYNWISSVLQDY